jgi:hypothetical protein
MAKRISVEAGTKDRLNTASVEVGGENRLTYKFFAPSQYFDAEVRVEFEYSDKTFDPAGDVEKDLTRVGSSTLPVSVLVDLLTSILDIGANPLSREVTSALLNAIAKNMITPINLSNGNDQP